MTIQVYYFIPEDGDDELHPNTFSLNSNEIDLEAIRQAFPLKAMDGEVFVFRFKFPWKKSYVWLDLTSSNDVIPLFNGQHVMKVSRMYTSNIQGDFIGSAASKSSQPTNKMVKKKKKTVSQKASHLTGSSTSSPGHTSTSKTPLASTVSAPAPSVAEVDFFNDSSSTKASVASTTASVEEVDFFGGATTATNRVSSAPVPAPVTDVDFFGGPTSPGVMTSSASSSSSSSSSSTSVTGNLMDLDFSGPVSSSEPSSTTMTDQSPLEQKKNNDVFSDMMFQM